MESERDGERERAKRWKEVEQRWQAGDSLHSKELKLEFIPNRTIKRQKSWLLQQFVMSYDKNIYSLRNIANSKILKFQHNYGRKEINALLQANSKQINISQAEVNKKKSL